ncbi:MAG TPA: alpha/beta hydrolase [Caulobacteraceae bacterium]|jgi:acetyl esterase/lipase|nr:alpha/beta hydrolase [Caulobacteraceae bacterium]
MADPALQRMLYRTALSLPEPVLRVMAGGGVIYRGGRTLDPKFQFLCKAWRGPRLSPDTDPLDARADWSEMTRAFAAKPEKGVSTETILLDGPGAVMTTRLYRPADQDPRAPMLVFFHAGAGVVGDLDASDGLCTELARIGRTAVLAPAYRLAPESRFPSGFEDALAAYEWAAVNASRYGATGAAVGGESMGGGFAAAICQERKRLGQSQPVLQLLIYPILDAASDSQSMQTYADAWPLSRDALRWAFGHYLGPEDDPADPRLSPLRAGDVSGLACAIIVTAGFDPLVDQGEIYARKLRAARVPLVYRCYDGLVHGFAAFAGVAPEAEIAVREIGGLFREGLDGRVPAACGQRDHSDAEKSLVI